MHMCTLRVCLCVVFTEREGEEGGRYICVCVMCKEKGEHRGKKKERSTDRQKVREETKSGKDKRPMMTINERICGKIIENFTQTDGVGWGVGGK